MDRSCIRRAEKRDLPTVVRLFATPDDGNKKDENAGEPLNECYYRAFDSIENDPNNMLMVAEVDARVVGAFQFTVIQYVANRGGRVGWIENVIVDSSMRGRGIGQAMMRWAIAEAQRRDCFRVQLTSNKVRKRAHVFYQRLGFVASHEGMKLVL
ncbi:MAG: GNAT family N-acetyltransferase [Polyangiales bacterium]